MVVHDVEVHEVRTGLEHGVDFGAETREIGREYRRGDPGGQWQWRHFTRRGPGYRSIAGVQSVSRRTAFN